MFDENFSFVASTVEPISVPVGDYTSADISPFTSRCSSPRASDLPHSRIPQPALPDPRFDTWRPPRHPSISALTNQLEHSAISDRPRSSSPGYMSSPTSSTSDADDGFFDGAETPATHFSDYSSDFDPSLWDLSMCNYSATSSPRPSLSLEAQATSSYTMRRKQRQALVRLQCLANRTPDIAMLLEECHPSSLPLSSETLWSGGTSRSNSTISLGATSGRIEKDRPSISSSGRKQSRVKKRQVR